MVGKKQKIIYLDNHATTRCDPVVLEAMLPFFCQEFSNPSSEIHIGGQQARENVEIARNHVANIIRAKPNEIIFTSGATESNNLAIQGVIRNNSTDRKEIITTPIEHKSILNQVIWLEKKGYKITFLPIDKTGRINIKETRKIISKETLLVSVQMANNEIGTIQPVKEISKITKNVGAILHTDAAQAVGKIPFDVRDIGVDLLSFSAHKMYGPKGVGAIFINGGPLFTHIQPLMFGGRQENNLRPGTLNVPGIIGFGKACEISSNLILKEMERISEVRDFFVDSLEQMLSFTQNGNIEYRLPGNCNFTIKGVEGEAIIINMPRYAISATSACNSGALEPSYVLQAIGVSRNDSDCSLRICFGRFNTKSDALRFSKDLVKTVNKLKKINS